MILSILLLSTLSSGVCGMSQPHYDAVERHAEEGDDITVEWSFSSAGNISIASIKIHCLTVQGLKVFYHLDKSFKESQHEQFAGRVHCDKDALGRGLVRLRLSRARTNDSGLYLCRMSTGFGRKVKPFLLNVSEAVAKPAMIKPAMTKPATTKPATTIPEPVPEGRQRICLYVVLGLTAAAVLVYYILYCRGTSEMMFLLPSAAQGRNPAAG